MQPINYNPGIPGFVKAHRSPEGPSLVMTQTELGGYDWLSVFWVTRLSHNAQAWQNNCMMVKDAEARRMANRLYDTFLQMGPPPDAIPDFQRERVYDWEAACIYPRFGSLTWIGCKRFLNRVWREAGDGDAPELINTRRYLAPISLGGAIHLPPDRKCWSKPVLLHEISHEIESDWHGPRFVSTYIDLCVEFLGFERRSLSGSATRFGVLFQA